MVGLKQRLKTPCYQILKSEWNLYLMEIYRGHFNTKCALVLTTLWEPKWHNLLSLEIGIIDRRLISMASLLFEVRLVVMTLCVGGVNGCFKYHSHS